MIEFTNSDFEDEINEDIVRKPNFEQNLKDFLSNARSDSLAEKINKNDKLTEIHKQLDILKNTFSLSNKILSTTRKPINGSYNSILTVNNVAIPKKVPKHTIQQSSVFKKTKFSLVKNPGSIMRAKKKNLMSINHIRK